METEEFKRRLQVAKAHAGITSQEELADVLKASGTIRGLSRAKLDNLAAGRERPTDDHLRVIAAACQVPLRYFTDESYDPIRSAVELERGGAQVGPADAGSAQPRGTSGTPEGLSLREHLEATLPPAIKPPRKRA